MRTCSAMGRVSPILIRSSKLVLTKMHSSPVCVMLTIEHGVTREIIIGAFKRIDSTSSAFATSKRAICMNERTVGSKRSAGREYCPDGFFSSHHQVDHSARIYSEKPYSCRNREIIIKT